ncbi:hypothetical protein [Pararhizobium antarcticum]|uniref:Uncharacterized protein n=1 Tax=Pararhizobium antarcticum TaxID=1798805 RepID=A0A657LWP0_9HYPH|nr:hypothetical protein [Pararhizobium antarcticum]OJG00186.1 hypothetical protein AX760_10675 [Pararhizobium antarcticum]OJG00816.1 hypothetical protein AX761_07780 [Rhizobium sp. 58]
MSNLPMSAISAMKQCEERGDFSTMRTHLNATGQEVIDGKGSLMDWSHPFNKEMLSAGAFKNRYPNQSITAAGGEE